MTVHEIISGPDFITATTTHSPKAISISSTNATAQRPVSSASPSSVSFGLSQQSQWGPSDIGNILFGCIASLLGAMTIGLTYYLYRRQLGSQQSGLWTRMWLSSDQVANKLIDESVELDDIPTSEPSDDNNASPLEDLPPSYTSVDTSTGSLAQYGTGSPVTPYLQD